VKKLINDPRSVVREMLEGLVTLHPGQALLEDENVVVRAGLPPFAERREVAVISGGGAGHEPAHAGYVGAGMLAAAATGDVFTSPSTDTVLAAIRATAGPAGALLVVKNYTGDRLNFGLAAELARAEGIPVEVVIVADDVSLRETVLPEHRRGIAGTVFVHKVAGAAAAAGLPLAEVAREAARAAEAVGSMGVALGACTVPAAGKPGFLLGDDEMELGLGIHGERGVRRTALEPVDRIVGTMLDTILADGGLASGDRVVMLVNGLGGTPPMELAIVARQALRLLAEGGVTVERAWSGNLLTALEMPGCSLSLLRVDEARLSRLDATTDAPAWPGSGAVVQAPLLLPTPAGSAAAGTRADAPQTPEGAAVRTSVLGVADAFEREEERLTELDSAAGDGDLGISFARGAAALRALPDNAWSDPATALAAMGDALRRAIAGSSGPFYATALLRASRHLAEGEAPSLSLSLWAAAFDAAVASIGELGGAKPGDRTMLDALHPAAEALKAAAAAGRTAREAVHAALEAAEAGAAATARMTPRLGRAAYLGERAVGTPDAGASAVVVWLRAVAESL